MVDVCVCRLMLIQTQLIVTTAERSTPMEHPSGEQWKRDCSVLNTAYKLEFGEVDMQWMI